MNSSTRWILRAAIPGLILFSMAAAAYADITTDRILDHAYASYSSVAATWAGSIKAHANWLFWTLTLISMVWTFGIMALRKADISEFFVEFIRFTMFTGIFWWFLDHGPTLATAIIDSMRKLGAEASAAAGGSAVPLPSPSGVVDIGFNLMNHVVEKSSVWSPINSTVGFLLSIIILVILALVAVNMLILMISAWIMAYAGIFFLGFGGSRWTSDMAINYFKNVLAVAAQIFTMVLIVGIGKGFIEEFYSHMSTGIGVTEMAAVMVAALILLALVDKLPPLIGGLATGGGVGALGGGYGMAQAAAAVGLAAAAISSAVSVISSVASNVAGTGSSLQEAFKKALDYENSADGQRDLMQSQSQDSSSFDQGESGPAWAGGANDANNSSTSSPQEGNGTAANSQPKPGNSNSGKGTPAGGGAQSSSGLMSTGAKAARVGIGTLSNLGAGIYETAKDSFKDRVSNSTMGKVAATIKGSADRQAQDIASARDNKNSLSAGSDNQVDREAEVAAFQNRNSVQDDGNGSDKIS